VTMSDQKMDLVLGQFFSPSLLSEKACGDFFRLLCEAEPKFVPVTYGKTEPLRKSFSVASIAQDWDDAIFWRGTRPASLGTFLPCNRFHPHDIIYFESRGAALIGAMQALQSRWATRFSTYFGYIHGVDDAHVKLPEYRARIMPFGQGLTWQEMQPRLPCVAWWMWFGPEYVDIVGRDKLFSAPVFQVKESAAGISLQLTESITILKDYPAYRAHRDALVSHLGPATVAPVAEQLSRG